jgi:hypothetical protein
MGPDIIIPVVVLAISIPLALRWARMRFRDNVGADDHDTFVAPSDRLTSNSLRELDSPPWRVVYEVAHERLNGIGHVLIGPGGVFALRTTMDPLPSPPRTEPDARAIAEAAITRGGVDDALRRCGMSSDRLVMVHWGVNESSEIAVDLMPGVTAIDGRSLATWAAGTSPDGLTPSQVDLAWQTILTAIGRPDPLR